MTTIRVDVTDEYLAHLISNPRQGLVELLDNALDADASHIVVEFDRSPLGAITGITVSDNGDGMTAAHAVRAFGHLGDSWKRIASHSSGGRRRRGRRGRGRWAAFALGDSVIWTSTTPAVAESGVTKPASVDAAPAQAGDEAAPGPGHERATVRGRRANLGEFEVDGPEPSPDAKGTIVRIGQVSATAQTLDTPATRERLLHLYAPALARQPSLTMHLDGTRLDPAPVILGRARIPVHLDAVADGEVTLTVIDWAAKVRTGSPALVLTDSQGEGLHDHLDQVPYAAWPYTAYLAWDGFADHCDVLPVSSMAPDPLPAAIEAGLQALREHLASRRDEAQAALIASWKAEDVYPYPGVPGTTLEEAERDLFDLVAVTAAPAVQAGSVESRRLSLRLIREAVQRDPTHLTRILTELLALEDEQLADLHNLLDRTGLAQVIAAGKVVAHRLDILDGLDSILNDPATAPSVLERRHLHEIVAAEPWLFGDEYALAQSDRGLTRVLASHRDLLGDPLLLDAGDERVTLDGRTARVDLMLSRVSEFSAELRQHLVVELKRPTVTIGAAEISQLEQYAIAIADDSRFHGQGVRWDFLLLGVEFDNHARRRVPANGVLWTEGPVSVRVLTWDRLLRARRHQLNFVQHELELATSDSEGVTELRRVHAAHLPEAVREPVPPAE